MKRFILRITPPILLDIAKYVIYGKYGWHGNYDSWEGANRDTTGYDQKEILEKVKGALLKVKNGEAVYERDSVLFEFIQYSWPLLAGLMFASAKCKGAVRVLDFGGSLGSTYYQNRRILNKIGEVSWNVVEQRHFVDCGKEYFEDDRLHFYYDVDSCMNEQHPDILILSSVLQYIERPYELLEKLLAYNFEFVLIDRTPFNLEKRDRIVVQKVLPVIYKASYPCWLFDEEKLMDYFKKHCYSLVESFYGSDGGGTGYTFKGHILQKGFCAGQN